MTDRDHPHSRPSRVLWVAIGAGAAVLLIVLAAGVVLILGRAGAQRDAHAQTACELMRQSTHQALMDSVISEIKAISEAKKSSNAGLRAAANTHSPASDLPPDNPLFENPGDVAANAVADWCATHPR